MDSSLSFLTCHQILAKETWVRSDVCCSKTSPWAHAILHALSLFMIMWKSCIKNGKATGWKKAGFLNHCLEGWHPLIKNTHYATENQTSIVFSPWDFKFIGCTVAKVTLHNITIIKYHQKALLHLMHNLKDWTGAMCFMEFGSKNICFPLLTHANIKSFPAFPKSKAYYVKRRNN